MRIDLYTKVVLTIIAASLVWICVRGATVAPLAAQSTREPQEVVVVNSRVPLPVVTPPRGSLTVRPGPEWYQDPLPIDAPRPLAVDAPRPLATRLTAIERSQAGRWDPVDVNVKEQPRRGAPGH